MRSLVEKGGEGDWELWREEEKGARGGGKEETGRQAGEIMGEMERGRERWKNERRELKRGKERKEEEDRGGVRRKQERKGNTGGKRWRETERGENRRMHGVGD